MKPILDLSYYQPSSAIDYDAMSKAISGVIIRAAYGSGVPNKWEGVDIEFEKHYAEFSKRGVPVGAYQFITEYQTVDAQVEVAMNAIKGKTLQLGFWADVELENGAELLSKSTVDMYLARMGGLVTGIYTSKVQWQRIMNVPYYNEYKLWVAHYGASTPWLPQGANGYWLWQNHGTETGRIAGYARGVDLSQFYGTQAEFDAWVGAVTIPEPEPEPEPIGLPYEAKVTASSLIVREAPSGADTGARLKKGKVVTVLEEEGNWASIYMWVSKDWIERVTNLPPTPPPSGALAVEPFSQNDPRWKNNRLGTSNVTIGQQGCLITCVAMVMRYYGHLIIDPAMLNDWLTSHNGYSNGNLLNWNAVALPISTWVDCLHTPAPLSQIDAALARGEPVIVHVDFVPSTAPINDHYVLLIGKLADEDYVMIDSWDGKTLSFKSRYKDARRFVYRIVSYRRQA